MSLNKNLLLNGVACSVLLCSQSFLGGLFGAVCEIDVLLNDAENRKTAELKTEDGKVEKHYMFYDGESVSGKVSRALSIRMIVWHIVSDMFFKTEKDTSVFCFAVKCTLPF